jgi:hypothetical protein
VTLQIATDILQEPGLSIFSVEPADLYLSQYMTSHPVDCNNHTLPLICKPTQSFEQNIFFFSSRFSIITFGLFATHRSTCIVPRAGQNRSGCHLNSQFNVNFRVHILSELKFVNFYRARAVIGSVG